MPIDKQKLIELIEKLMRMDLHRFNEAQIINYAILPVLSFLGWDPSNPDEAIPEYVVGKFRVDYVLKVLNEKIFIEAKAGNESLDNHQEQLLRYAFNEGIQLAILTNGSTWWFYLPLKKGSWEQRRFYSISFSEQDAEEIANKFIDFLAKEVVASGNAFLNASQVYKSNLKKSTIKESIPKAWNKLITDRDDKLLELLMDKTEEICGYRPKESDIKDFLQDKERAESPFQMPSTKDKKKKSISSRTSDGSKGIPIALSDLFSVIRLVNSDYTHTEAFNEIANQRGVDPKTVHSNCTKHYAIDIDSFQHLLQNTEEMKKYLLKKFPDHANIINQEIKNI